MFRDRLQKDADWLGIVIRPSSGRHLSHVACWAVLKPSSALMGLAAEFRAFVLGLRSTRAMLASICLPRAACLCVYTDEQSMVKERCARSAQVRRREMVFERRASDKRGGVMEPVDQTFM